MALPYINHKSAASALNEYHDRIEEIKILLKTALSNNPLSVWLLKDRFPTIRQLHITHDDLNSCTQNKLNRRLDNVLAKVLRGEDVQMMVFGGSNTAGGGLQEEESSLKGTFFNILNHWWRKIVTPATGSRLKLNVIAMGGTSSSFFQFCYKVYCVDDNYDLVFIELSVNDAKAVRLGNVNQSLPLEQFIRQLTSSPNNPALFFVNLFYVRRHGCLNLMDLGQGILCDHYNVTTFNLRDSVCHCKSGKFVISSKALRVQVKDRRHINLLGHAQIALMMINMISKTFWKIMSPRYKYISTYHLPPPVYIKARDKIIEHPLCWTTLTPNYKTKVIHNTLNVSVVKQKGFFYVEDVLIGGIHYTGTVYRTDAYSAWVGKKYGSEITIAFTIVNEPVEISGSIPSRSVGFVSRTIYDGGTIEVWLNDDFKERVTVHLSQKFRQTIVRIIAVQVPAGEHTLNVRIVKGGPVSFIGIVIGPPGGPY